MNGTKRNNHHLASTLTAVGLDLPDAEQYGPHNRIWSHRRNQVFSTSSHKEQP
jgi:hypothetical protein